MAGVKFDWKTYDGRCVVPEKIVHENRTVAGIVVKEECPGPGYWSWTEFGQFKVFEMLILCEIFLIVIALSGRTTAATVFSPTGGTFLWSTSPVLTRPRTRTWRWGGGWSSVMAPTPSVL